MPQFFFDYFNGNRLEKDEDGLELPDADAAYLEAFRAATDMWGEALLERRNPSLDCFKVRDRTGIVVLEVPFAEVLESSKRRTKSVSAKSSETILEDTVDTASRHVLRGRKIVADQRNRIDRLREQGRSTQAAEYILSLFTQSLAIFEDHLKTLRPPPS